MADGNKNDPAGAIPPQVAPDNAAKVSWAERLGGRVKAKGIPAAAREGFNEIKQGFNLFSDASKGHRAVAFGRVGTMAVGAALAAHSLKAKDSEGQERSGLVRLGEAVLGAGAMAGGLLAGGR